MTFLGLFFRCRKNIGDVESLLRCSSGDEKDVRLLSGCSKKCFELVFSFLGRSKVEDGKLHDVFSVGHLMHSANLHKPTKQREYAT